MPQLMPQRKSRKDSIASSPIAEGILAKLPLEAQKWAESLPWEQRRYVLSLCHLICATPPEKQAEFLDDYTADGLVSRVLQDRDNKERVKGYLNGFHIHTELSELVLRNYIRQFYIHSAQDAHRQPDLYLESALKLVTNIEERNNVFNYILGFELLKMMFRMSWWEHEKLYRLQRNQEAFIKTYIKPIQRAHEINGIIVPRDIDVFFAKRDHFIQKPKVSDRKLIELVMATFTTDVVTNFGFSIIRHLKSFCFDYEYVFEPEPEAIFQ
ncbi:hypothetical protein NDA01_19500 [Trichocoleus desertorum AS-A10]|uniref:cobyrinic acid a,c-diamide synthase n=1 Tax=Trichocoleus desertorum TaxID=1481672 RepID=UPI003298762C